MSGYYLSGKYEVNKKRLINITALILISSVWLYYLQTFMPIAIMGLGIIWGSLVPTKFKKAKTIVLSILAVPVLGGLICVSPAIVLEQRGKSIAKYEVGRELAIYCQTLKRDMHDGNIGTAWLPRAVAEINPFWVSLDPNSAYIALGGGFFPLGASLELDSVASTDEHTVWKYSYGLADRGRRHIATIELSQSDVMPLELLIQKAIEGYDRQIAKRPKKLVSHKEKIMFLLKFGIDEKAAQACKYAVDTIPDDAMLQLLLAFILSGNTEKTPAAATQLEQWTAMHANFPNYCYLSYYYQLEGNEPQAIAAIEKAIEYPLTDNNYYNEYFLARCIAHYALTHNKADLALKICDAVSRRETRPSQSRFDKNYYSEDFVVLKALAESNDTDLINQKLEYRDLDPFRPSSTNAVQEITIGRHIFFKDDKADPH